MTLYLTANGKVADPRQFAISGNCVSLRLLFARYKVGSSPDAALVGGDPSLSVANPCNPLIRQSQIFA